MNKKSGSKNTMTFVAIIMLLISMVIGPPIIQMITSPNTKAPKTLEEKISSMYEVEDENSIKKKTEEKKAYLEQLTKQKHKKNIKKVFFQSIKFFLIVFTIPLILLYRYLTKEDRKVRSVMKEYEKNHVPIEKEIQPSTTNIEKDEDIDIFEGIEYTKTSWNNKKEMPNLHLENKVVEKRNEFKPIDHEEVIVEEESESIKEDIKPLMTEDVIIKKEKDDKDEIIKEDIINLDLLDGDKEIAKKRVNKNIVREEDEDIITEDIIKLEDI